MRESAGGAAPPAIDDLHDEVVVAFFERAGQHWGPTLLRCGSACQGASALGRVHVAWGWRLVVGKVAVSTEPAAVLISPSILSADFGQLAREVQAVESAGADRIHVDVMDGRFVPAITIGPLVVGAVRKATKLPVDVHLMIVEPERYLADFAEAGADELSVHVEATNHLPRALDHIRSLGKRAGVVLNPQTPAG